MAEFSIVSEQFLNYLSESWSGGWRAIACDKQTCFCHSICTKTGTKLLPLHILWHILGIFIAWSHFIQRDKAHYLSKKVEVVSPCINAKFALIMLLVGKNSSFYIFISSIRNVELQKYLVGLIYQSCVGLCADLSAGIIAWKDTPVMKIPYMVNPSVRLILINAMAETD